MVLSATERLSRGSASVLVSDELHEPPSDTVVVSEAPAAEPLVATAVHWNTRSSFASSTPSGVFDTLPRLKVSRESVVDAGAMFGTVRLAPLCAMAPATIERPGAVALMNTESARATPSGTRMVKE